MPIIASLTSHRQPIAKCLDALYVSVLLMYVLAGMRLAPFHGDESTTIYVSRDWFTLTQGDGLSALLYRNPPGPGNAATDQDLRLINGVISKYAIGITGSLMGWTVNTLNDQWDWGADWDYNHAYRHVPSEALLFVARLTSTLMTMVSVAVVFAIGYHVNGRGTAWIAATVYALMPAVLLNGRRAVYEGATMLFIAAATLAAILVARHVEQWRRWLVLGVMSGLALASKHVAVLTLVPLFVGLIALNTRQLGRTVMHSVGATVAAVIVFLALNPVWWSAPLSVPQIILRNRSALLADQVQFFGGYHSTLERLDGLIRLPLGPAQYYEDQRGWPQWIGGEIAAYEASGLAGLQAGWLVYLSPLVAVVAVWELSRPHPLPPSPLRSEGELVDKVIRHTDAHIVERVRERTSNPYKNGSSFFNKVANLFPFSLLWRGGQGVRIIPARRLFLIFAVLTTIAVYALTPLGWQRYYLPLAAPWALLWGIGLTAVARVTVSAARMITLQRPNHA